MNLQRLERPVLLVDPDKARRNIERMAAKAAASGVAFRPHAKTHQSAAVAEWYRPFGIGRIDVSSLDMAGYFQTAGWTDILVGVPLNIHQIPAIDTLAASCDLQVLVESEAAASALAEKMKSPLGVWIEIDTGYHRTGIPVDRPDHMAAVARILARNPRLKLYGLLAHDGHTYGAVGREAVGAVFERSLDGLKKALSHLADRGFPGLALSIGDTPSCSLMESFPAPITEIRPGNFIFYDLTQAAVGACRTADIAAVVACPVISLHPERGEAIVYGGGVHISKESVRGRDGGLCFGRIARLNAGQTGWMDALPDVSLVSLSQEQGIVRGSADFLASLALGDTLVILPVHACLTANLHPTLFVVGQGPISKFRF
jgi:D-serine deaminase-like pyridoxal phosphate-dependent protein